MPLMLKRGHELRGSRGTYRVADDTRLVGGQAVGYYVTDAAGRQLFLKQFMEPTLLSDESDAFVRRQAALIDRLPRVRDFVCIDVDFFESRGTFYKVSERMTGSTLKDRLDAAAGGAPWSDAERMTNARVLAHVVKEIHDVGITHLDLKPDNCFLAERALSTGRRIQVMRLLDFDGAEIEGAPSRDKPLGTAKYCSPEHADPTRYGRPGRSADVFAVGIMLHEILARRYPFASSTGYLHRAAERTATIAPWIPGRIAGLMWDAIHPVASRRPTAAELHGALLTPSEPSAGVSRDSVVGPAKPVASSRSEPPPAVAVGLVLRGKGRDLHVRCAVILGRDTLRGIAGADGLSQEQIRIFPHAGAWCVAPLSSRVATFRNGARVPDGARCTLLDGDRLQMGDVDLAVEWSPP